jgi:hypothetical protein
MGLEFKILLVSMDVSAFDIFIRNSPFFTGYDAQHKLYNLCLSGSEKSETIADAWVVLENDGVYFCDNCTGNTVAILQMLIEEAKKYSNEVKLEEL